MAATAVRQGSSERRGRWAVLGVLGALVAVAVGVSLATSPGVPGGVLVPGAGDIAPGTYAYTVSDGDRHAVVSYVSHDEWLKIENGSNGHRVVKVDGVVYDYHRAGGPVLVIRDMQDLVPDFLLDPLFLESHDAGTIPSGVEVEVSSAVSRSASGVEVPARLRMNEVIYEVTDYRTEIEAAPRDVLAQWREDASVSFEELVEDPVFYDQPA